MVAKAKAAGLDIVPVTEYVTDAHWDRLGKAQRDHPDVLIWPGREVITYFGHMIVLNETRHVMEHRVGYRGITENEIAKESAADGGIVQLAHPTIYPPAVFGSACRGCFTENVDRLDFSNFTSLEVVTESSIADLNGTKVPNPFVTTAVALWERKLREGHRLTAISGSDNKSGDGYGSTSTMVYADKLSRPAVDKAIRLGHTLCPRSRQGQPHDGPVRQGPQRQDGDVRRHARVGHRGSDLHGQGWQRSGADHPPQRHRGPTCSHHQRRLHLPRGCRPHPGRGAAGHVLGCRGARPEPLPRQRDRHRHRQPGLPGRQGRPGTEAPEVRRARRRPPRRPHRTTAGARPPGSSPGR